MERIIFFDLGKTLVGDSRNWLPGAKALLNALRSRGLRLGIVSNTEGLHSRQDILDRLPADFDLGLFEPSLVLFSSEVGKAKPQKGIFQEAVARAGLPAAQCLYCSEDMLETLVAQHVGMRSIRVRWPPTQTNDDLAEVESTLTKLDTLI